jgi:ubiquinone/menaquinone biosynthesis C-methylase UbiE
VQSLEPVDLLSIDPEQPVEDHWTPYEKIAEEYYNETAHPTCANFREASRLILEDWIGRLSPSRPRIALDASSDWHAYFLSNKSGSAFNLLAAEDELNLLPSINPNHEGPNSLLCEVGAGASLLAEILSQHDRGLDDLLITDASEKMLSKSHRWVDEGAMLENAPADNLPLPDSSCGLLVSSLGDPYNTSEFWKEVHRVLHPSGDVLFTTPAYEWASRFRDDTQEGYAKFILQSGEEVRVPSYIYPDTAQKELITSASLSVEEIRTVPLSEIGSEFISPKLRVDGEELPVVTGYWATPRRNIV